MKKLSFSALAFMLPFAALAHEGHGAWHGTIWHYIASFWHVLPLTLSVVAIVYLVRRVLTSRKKA
jgi:hypothetical protein